MKGIYLCAKNHRIPGTNLDYNDIEQLPGITHCCSCEDIDISKYDYIIATPPCNYYSRANYRRETSKVAQATKHLLPYCIEVCIKSGKPFIIENVCNSTLLPKTNLYEFDFGNHHFYTNVFMLVIDRSYARKQNKQNLSYGNRDDNYNVHIIINQFLEIINAFEL